MLQVVVEDVNGGFHLLLHEALEREVSEFLSQYFGKSCNVYLQVSHHEGLWSCIRRLFSRSHSDPEDMLPQNPQVSLLKLY